VSLTLITRKDRPVRKHRAIDRLAQREQELAELQQRLDDADALILRQAIRLGELEAENDQAAARLQRTEDALINVGKDRDALERYVRDLENQVTDRDRRLELRTWADAVATKTQEMPVITRVMPRHKAPFATADPAA
jgi:chromosome segregation ATPase